MVFTYFSLTDVKKLISDPNNYNTRLYNSNFEIKIVIMQISSLVVKHLLRYNFIYSYIFYVYLDNQYKSTNCSSSRYIWMVIINHVIILQLF